MQPITDYLSGLVSAAFEASGYDKKYGTVGISDRPELCQFQCNGAFAAAKVYRKAPMAIAGEVAAALRAGDVFAAAETVAPGFVNLTLCDTWLAGRAAELAGDAHCGIPQIESPETIVLDYGGANVAKSLHIGHLRSAIIGESVKRLARAMGFRVLGDVHLGDWGLQIGLVITELTERHPEWACIGEAFVPGTDPVPELSVELLSEIYPCASAKSKQDPDYLARARNATAELQSGRPGYIALWKEMMRISRADLEMNYDRLGVTFDYWYGESNADNYVDRLLDTLNQKGLMHESEGAMVVDVAEETDKAPMPPVLIKKSDGSLIYTSTDLATLIQRQEDWQPDRVWYVVDKRQGLHFTQVFRCAKKAGIVPEQTELEFLGFGTMNGSDGKPYKTRDGGVMRLGDLIATVTQAADAKLGGSDYVSGQERAETARRVGIAALKFGDLINHRAKDYIFDLEKFLSFEGKTGTYLLYTVTRIQSILKKAGNDQAAAQMGAIYSDVERDLLLKLVTMGETFRHALDERAPNYICENAYQIATAFSRFYHENYILDEPDEAKKSAWLALCVLTLRCLCMHLDVLGIETVENM